MRIAAIAALWAALTLPWAGEYLYYWDAGNYALAMREFNVLFDRPQMPGYPAYIGLAKLAWSCCSDPHHALLAVNWLAGLATLLLTASALRRLQVARPWLWLVLLATTPLFRFFGCVSWMYAVHAFVYALLLRVCLAVRLDGRLRLLLPVAYGFAASLRPDALLFLLPPLLLVLWQEKSMRYAAYTAVLSTRTVLLWLGPLVLVHWPHYFTYQKIFAGLTGSAQTLIARVTENVVLLPMGGLALCGLLLMLCAGVLRLRGGAQSADPAPYALLAALLIGPLAFYIFVHAGYGQYAVAFAAPLTVLAALLTRGWPRPTLTALLLACMLLNLLYFHGSSRPYTARAIARHDARMAGMLETIRRYPPATTTVIADVHYKELVNYLPEYTVIWPVAARTYAGGRNFPFLVRCRNYREDHQGRYLYDAHTDNVQRFAAGESVLMVDGHLAGKVHGVTLQPVGTLQTITITRPSLLTVTPVALDITVLPD